MTAIDAERALRLDRQFDALLSRDEVGSRESGVGGRETIDTETVAALRGLHALASRPVPDADFVDRLREELMGSESVLPHRVILSVSETPPSTEGGSGGRQSRLIGDPVGPRPRSFVPQDDTVWDDSEWWRDDAVAALNDTQVMHAVFPPPSLNGHGQLLSTAPLSRPWWQRWEFAAAILVIVTLSGYLALALSNLGRTVPPLTRLSAITAQKDETAPVELRIGAIGIEAPIEAVQAFPADMVTPWAGDIWATGWQDGGPIVIPEPSDPWTVAWLDDSAAPGEGGNVVLYGHLEYWDPAHAVFWNLKELVPGDQIDVIGENHEVFTYAVDWTRQFSIDVDDEQQREILGPTTNASVTLITSSGTYDKETGTYPEVLVVRASLVTNARDLIAGQPWRLRSEAIHLDALIAPRQPPEASTLVRAGSSLVPEDVLDEDWILIQPADTPAIVSWRADSAAIGEGSNVVLEGHRYVSGSEPAVFRSLNALRPGTELELFGSSRTVGTYEVEWVRQYPVAVSPEQRQEILGPTDTERLTLITDAGELNRATGTYPDVLVVRARFVGSAPLAILDTPGPGECTVQPRSVEEISAAAATVLPEPRHSPDPTPLETLEGEPADAATNAAVVAAERKLVACLNANDPLRAYALFTDKGFERLLDYAFPPSEPYDPTIAWAPDFSILEVPATPLPEAYQLAMVSVDSVRVLPDGRVAATATIESGGPGMLGIPNGIPVVHIFEPGDRYLIDEFSVPLLMGTPTP